MRRMDVFGSAVRARDFDPEHSDIDLLVEFTPDPSGSSWGPHFELKDRLEALLGRPVDLVEAGAVRNPYILASIARDRQPLYAA